MDKIKNISSSKFFKLSIVAILALTLPAILAFTFALQINRFTVNLVREHPSSATHLLWKMSLYNPGVAYSLNRQGLDFDITNANKFEETQKVVSSIENQNIQFDFSAIDYYKDTVEVTTKDDTFTYSTQNLFIYSPNQVYAKELDRTLVDGLKSE